MAKHKPAKHTTAVEARVRHIAAMMRSLEWQTGKSGPALAAEWKLSEDRVAELAAEASKRVRAEVLDPARVGQTVGCALEKVMREAIAANDRKAAVSAARTWAEIAGAVAPRQLNVNAHVEGLADFLAAAFPHDAPPDED